MASYFSGLNLNVSHEPRSLFTNLHRSHSLFAITTPCLFFHSFNQFILFTSMGWIEMHPDYLMEAYAIMIIILGLAFFRHRSNIVKLLKGTENKIGVKKK